jgi:pilus assembly protein FimV
MKVRKLAVALALAGGLGSGVAQALGLGEIELQSYLNEPLNAEINLRKSEGIAPGDVFVNIAPQSAFERVGIDRTFFLTKLNFQVTTAPDGNLVVNVSTREPLREPYLNFLVEVTWPSGRLMREYAVLVDPPVYAEESGMQEQVSAPATRQTSQPQRQAREASPPQAERGASQARAPAPRTLGPTNAADTLWTIAARVRPDNSVTMQQTMLAIQDLNQNAFIDGNINRLKRGEILRIPDENQIRSRSRAQAIQEVAAQNDALSTPARTVDAAADAATETRREEAAGSSDGDQLRLIAADDASSRDADEGGSAGGDGQTAGGVDAGTAVAMEQLESSRRENEELSGRVDDLQEQVETLQRLLELKNSQLAEMQSGQADSPTGPESGAAPDPAGQQETASATSAAGQREAEAAPATEQPELAAEQSGSEAEQSASAAEQPELTVEQPDSAAGQPEPAAEPQESSAGQPDAAAEEPAAAVEQPEPVQQPFPGNIIDAITNNPLYQIALGGGLIVLLLLLLLLGRRNSKREKAFYDELNNETDVDETDSFDLTFESDDDSAPVAAEDDAMAEADAYIAYGRNDQAAHTLETAISREPSRTDLRLKLLAVYADIQDRESFDKQFREIEALDDDAVIAEAANIQARLEETESMPSIDDLESQLRSGGTDHAEDADREPEDLDPGLDQPDADAEQEPFEETPEDIAGEESDDRSGDEAEEDDEDLIEYDLSDFELDDADTSGSEQPEEPDESDGSFEYTLDELDTEESDELELDEDDDEDDLSLDLESLETELEDEDVLPADTASEASEETYVREEKKEPVAGSGSPDEDDDGELDESFLDELDAELDKVASEDESTEDVDGSELDDLELDVSDEDLALMEEFSESDEATSTSDKPENDYDDGILPPVASDKIADDDPDLDDADLGDDDDFDFLTGTDEAATKLDLARAYVEMGDVDGARDILEEVALEGSDEQKAEAQDLLKNLS